MATCPDCKREMRLAPTCLETLTILVRGKPYPRIRYPEGTPGKCDCGIKPGGIHHFGCDMEPCPACGGQLIMCDCGAELSSDVERRVKISRLN